jgi:hypothetical protein
MAHFARIDENNIVQEVIVVHNDCAPDEKTGQDFLASIGFEGIWKQTSYNTFMGQHTSGGTAYRKNYASIGYSYDEERDAFIPPQPDKKITNSGNPIFYDLNEDTCQWVRRVVDPS